MLARPQKRSKRGQSKPMIKQATEADKIARTRRAAAWFRELRDSICAAFEAIEQDYEGDSQAQPGQFKYREWQRPAHNQFDSGGGVSAIMHGRVFEKVGVNVSTVEGEFSPSFREEIPGAADHPRFWATGISLVAHLRSPLVPAVHMNTRHITTAKSWFGGGADITPMFPESPQAKEDAASFHAALRKTCDQYHQDYYRRFSQWCDDYFYLKHRDEHRGLGGIFYDNLEEDWSNDFAFTQDVGRAFLDVYPTIVRRRMAASWTDQQRQQQLIRRGRYVEFNLLYDRGTRFGLMTGGDVEAILMSLPPEVCWP